MRVAANPSFRFTGFLLALLIAGHASVRADTSAPARSTGAPRDPLVLTYVANEGVLLASGRHKVLIDALFNRPDSAYRAPAPETLDKIVKGAAPFDGVGLVLVTHSHADHFDPLLAVRFLEGHPKTRLVAPADAVAEMRKSTPHWTAIAGRVASIDLNVDEHATRDVAGNALRAFRTRHSGGNPETPMNLMFLVELGGWQVFHEGDSDATVAQFRGFGLQNVPIDLALVHFWFPLDPEKAGLLQEVLRPKHIGLIHLPIRLEGDAPGKIDMVRRNYPDIFLLLPGAPDRTFR